MKMANPDLRLKLQNKAFITAPGVFDLVSAKLLDRTQAEAIYMSGKAAGMPARARHIDISGRTARLGIEADHPAGPATDAQAFAAICRDVRTGAAELPVDPDGEQEFMRPIEDRDILGRRRERLPTVT